MTHDAAPATQLVATHCLFCHRALVDALSVERGIGPVCAEKHGANAAPGAADWFLVSVAIEAAGLTAALAPKVAAQDAHKLANAVLHAIGADVHAARVPHLAVALDAAGFKVLAAKVAEALRPVVRVERDGACLVVRTGELAPAVFDAYVAAMRRVDGRRWDRDRKANVVPATARASLWDALKAALPAGTMVVGARVAVL